MGSKYEIISSPIEKHCTIMIMGNRPDNDLHFAGYDSAGLPIWEHNISKAIRYNNLRGALQTVKRLDAIDACKQWIADVYHCSDTWGEKMTAEDMRVTLEETAKEKDPDDYSPDPSTAPECAAYWNELCDLYPN